MVKDLQQPESFLTKYASNGSATRGLISLPSAKEGRVRLPENSVVAEITLVQVSTRLAGTRLS